MNKVDYITKMNSILNDYTKFDCINLDEKKLLLKLKDKLNNFLRPLKNTEVILLEHFYVFRNRVPKRTIVVRSGNKPWFGDRCVLLSVE